MSTDISFDENKYKIKSKGILNQSESSGIIKYLINKGIIKNEKQGSVILILLTVLFMTSSFLILYNNIFKAPELPPITNEQLQ
jgi:hypothetical protein